MDIFAVLNTTPPAVTKTYTAPDGSSFDVEFLPVLQKHQMEFGALVSSPDGGKPKADAGLTRKMALYCVTTFLRVGGKPVELTAEMLDNIAAGSPAATLLNDAMKHYTDSVSGEAAKKPSQTSQDGGQ